MYVQCTYTYIRIWSETECACVRLVVPSWTANNFFSTHVSSYCISKFLSHFLRWLLQEINFRLSWAQCSLQKGCSLSWCRYGGVWFQCERSMCMVCEWVLARCIVGVVLECVTDMHVCAMFGSSWLWESVVFVTQSCTLLVVAVVMAVTPTMDRYMTVLTMLCSP